MHYNMRAIVTRGHGGRKVLRMEEVERPAARGKKVLIEVCAAGVNPVDWRIRRGEFRPLSALMPRRVPGCDVAGVVAAVGDEVHGFALGDRVFTMLGGVAGGGYAEYTVAGEDGIATMPKNLSFEEAAAVPLAALTAVQAIRDALREVVRNAPHACDTGELARRKVLINGEGSGAVGTFAVQFAKISGAEVTAVCSVESSAFARELGADHVVDYQEEDFARHKERYDVIFDVVGNRSFGACKRVLRPAGVYVTTEPGPRNFLSQVATIPAHKKARVVLVKPSGEDLSLLKQLFEAGRLRAVLGSVYPLEDAAEAHAHGETGHARGKIVLKVDR